MKTTIEEKNVSGDLHLGGTSYVNIKASTLVRVHEVFEIFTSEGPIKMVAEVSVDLANIPQNYHEICLNVLTSKYLNKVNFGDNPFSDCKPVVKRKWWQFWKNQYFTS